MPAKDDANCGGPSCRQFVDDVAERIGQPLREQHTAGVAAIKELMTLHYNTLKADVAEIKATADRQGNEVFSRLRRVESRQDVMEATAMSETRVKQIVDADKGVQWARGQRGWVKALWYSVSTAAILGAVKLIFWIAATADKTQVPKP